MTRSQVRFLLAAPSVFTLWRGESQRTPEKAKAARVQACVVCIAISLRLFQETFAKRVSVDRINTVFVLQVWGESAIFL